MTSTVPLVLSLICLASLTSAARADGPGVPIHDDAGLFHADAIARAEQGIADIRRTFDHNLFVRTTASASPRQRRLLPFLGRPQINRMLEEQARTYADESGLPGIYVVICNHPRDVHVIVRPRDDAEFTRHDAEALRRMLARRLHDSPDAALHALVNQVHDTLQDQVIRGSYSSTVNDLFLAGLLGGGLALWVLLGMVRFKLRAGRMDRPARETSALLGVLFGCPAGLWIYDKLIPCPAGTSPPLCEPQTESLDERIRAATVRKW